MHVFRDHGIAARYREPRRGARPLSQGRAELTVLVFRVIQRIHKRSRIYDTRAWRRGTAMAQQVCVVLSTAARERLAAIAADRNRPRKHVERARIVLASADRGSAQRVAQRIGVSRPTVWRWQQRFAEAGAEGVLCDETRPPWKSAMRAATTGQLLAATSNDSVHRATNS